MNIPENKLKVAMQAGDVQYGIWLNTGSSLVAELAGGAGFDWCLIDAEHGPNSLTEILPQLQGLAAADCPAVVRVPEAQTWIIKQTLDLGVQTILVPMVDDADKAAEMARAMRYPPQGKRGMGAALARASGYGANVDYGAQANAQMCLLVQAESAAAIKNIDAIASTDGVDGVFIGPADLSADMGYPGESDHPEVMRAIDHAIARTIVAGKIAGIITFDQEKVADYATKGITFLGVGGDIAVLRQGLRSLSKMMKPQQ